MSAGELIGRMRRQAAIAMEVKRTGNTEAGMELLIAHDQLLHDELAFWRRLADDPAALKSLKLTREQVGLKLDGAEAALRDAKQPLAKLSLMLAGLEPEGGGSRLWVGNVEDIVTAINHARRAGVHVEILEHDPNHRGWRINLNGEEIIIRQRADEARRKPGKPHGEPAHLASRPTLEKALETRAEMVPGSTFRGRSSGNVVPLATAHAALEEVLRTRGDVESIEQVDQARYTKAEDRERATQTYVVTMKPIGGAQPERLTIRLVVGPLEGQTVARTILNPTQQGYSPTVNQQNQPGTYGHKVKGRYVIQLSDELDAAHVNRAIAHELAELYEIRRLNTAKQYPGQDALRPGARGGRLSPDDLGRLAEIHWLAEQLGSPDPALATRARSELAALVDHLGLSDRHPGAAARRELAKQRLDPTARAALEEARHGERFVGQQDWAAMQSRAQQDTHAEQTRSAKRATGHEMPTTVDERGHRLTDAALKKRAKDAADHRAAQGEVTWHHLEDLHRAATARGDLTPQLPYELQIGGGASLAARNRNDLLIDDRGRWQADGNNELAQTAHQVQQAKDAKVGNPTHVTDPDTRLPLHAVNYWQDHIAAQGPVVNGRATMRIGPRGELLVDISYQRPGDTTPQTLTFKAKGIPYVSTGFVPERIPGAPFNGATALTSAEAVTARLKNVKADAASSPALKAKANAALLAMEATPLISNDDLMQLGTIIQDPELRAALVADGAAERAMNASDAVIQWQQLRGADDPAHRHVLFGDEANLGREQAMRSHNWAISGTGGTGVSAAEIILRENPKAHVMMIGADEPAGLMQNDQFLSIAKLHADALLAVRLGISPGDGRLTLTTDRVGAAQQQDRAAWEAGGPRPAGWVDESDIPAAKRSTQIYDANGASTHTQASGYIAAIGRQGDYPPIVASLIDQARRRNGNYQITLRFHDRQYIGYTASIQANGGTVHIDVTGAASRFLPDSARRHMPGNHADAWRKMEASSDWAAPAESGNFAGGWAATTTQTDQYATWRSDPPLRNPSTTPPRVP
ncbi:MAG: hypothetical protein H0T79_24145 [Deltaproteobacteria bacterium]|nr:hypothetical protein [Deltaproteobacteria bacterium]